MALDFTAFNNPIVVDALQRALSETVAPSEAYGPIDYSSFEQQAAEEEAPWINRKLDLAMRKLDQDLKQFKETAEQQERFQKETETRFRGVEDRGFARLLDQAQSGFSGRGTFTSGFRQESIGQEVEDRGDRMAEFAEKLRQATEARQLGVQQREGEIGLQKDITTFDIEEQRRRNEIQRQLQLGQIAEGQRAESRAEYEDKLADKFVGFLQQKGGA